MIPVQVLFELSEICFRVLWSARACMCVGLMRRGKLDIDPFDVALIRANDCWSGRPMKSTWDFHFSDEARVVVRMEC